MYYIYVLVAGVTGTTIMTLFLYLIGKLTHKNFNILWLLGSVVMRKKTKPTFLIISIGTLLHYFTGIFYSFLFYFLWSVGVGKPNFLYSILFGIITGIIAMVVWYFLLRKKEFNTPVSSFIISNFTAHIIFSLVVFYVYLFFVRYPLPIYQSLNFC